MVVLFNCNGKVRTIDHTVLAAGARVLIGDFRWVVTGIIHLPASLEQMLRADKSTDAAVVNTFTGLGKYGYFGHAGLPYRRLVRLLNKDLKNGRAKPPARRGL